LGSIFLDSSINTNVRDKNALQRMI